MGFTKLKVSKNVKSRLSLQVDCTITDSITVGDFFKFHEVFVEDKVLEGLAPRTIKEHRTNINYFKKYLEGATQSKIDRVAEMELKINHFKEYIRYMIVDKEYSPFTTNVRERTLKCYLKWLFDEKYLSENLSMKLKLQKTPEDTIKPLTNNEVKQMLSACDTSTYAGLRDFTVMLLMLDCGIRVGETVETLIDDVDTKHGFITIRGEVAKSRISRQLPISPQVGKLLKELISIAKESESQYVFQSIYGGKIKQQNMILAFRRIGDKIGLNKRCSPHVFRHTFATNAVKESMDMFTLQKIMGHSTLLTTRKYVQLENSDLKMFLLI